MLPLEFTVGNAQHRAAMPGAVLAPLDVMYFRRIGIIASGQKVLVHYKAGIFTGLDALFCADDFDCDIDAPWGEAFIDGTNSPGFPYSDPDHERQFNAAYGHKGGWMLCSGNFVVGKGIRIENFTNGVNCPGIFLSGPTYIVLKGGVHVLLTKPTTLVLDGVIIRRCDNAVRSSDTIAPGSWLLVKGGSIIEENGVGDGQSHDFYVGRLAAFAIVGSTARNSRVGHAVKSRARVTIVAFNKLRDTPDVPKASSCVADQSGGQFFMFGNDFGQGANDQNLGKEIYFYTERDGDGPHRCIVTGNTGHSDEPYRGAVVRVSNPRRDPAVLWTQAKQLTDAAGALIWNPVDVGIDGNDIQFTDAKLDFGATPGGAYDIPTNNGINLITPLPGNNRLIAKNSPAAQTPFAAINKNLLRGCRVGRRIADLLPADYTPALMYELAAISAEETATWTPPEKEEDPMVIAQLTAERDAALKGQALAESALTSANSSLATAFAATQAQKTRADTAETKLANVVVKIDEARGAAA
jgi:hypothetical protein